MSLSQQRIAFTLEGRTFSRIGAVAGSVGILVYAASAILHPGTAPHHTEAAFSHYAAEPYWALIHLGELLGILLMTVAILAVAWRLRGGVAGIWAALGSAAILVFSSIYAVFIAVDGVALGILVRRWSEAAPGQQQLLFEAAYAVRQVEAGLFGVQWFVFGIAAGLLAAAFFARARHEPSRTWFLSMGWLSAAASLGTAAFGIAQAVTGFSEVSMAFQTGLLVAVLWIVAVAVFLAWNPGFEPPADEPVRD